MSMSKKDPRLTPKQIEKLLSNNPNKIDLNISPIPAYIAPEIRVVFSNNNIDYDTLSVIDQIKGFCSFIKDVLSRYEENQRRQEEAETMEMDIEHAIELAKKLTEKEKKQLYSKLTEALQTRRACKSENEILQPLYDYFRDKTLLSKLAQLQGTVSDVKDIITNRTYSCRTTILNDFRTDSAPSESSVE